MDLFPLRFWITWTSFSSATSSRQLQIRAGPTASTLACSFSGPPSKPTLVSWPRLSSTAALTVTDVHRSKNHVTVLFIWNKKQGANLQGGEPAFSGASVKPCRTFLLLRFCNKSCFPSLSLPFTLGSVQIEPFYCLTVFKHISGSLAFFNYCFSTRLFCVNTSWQ